METGQRNVQHMHDVSVRPGVCILTNSATAWNHVSISKQMLFIMLNNEYPISAQLSTGTRCVMHVNSIEYGCIQEVLHLHMLEFRTPGLINEIPQFHTNHKIQNPWPCHDRTCRFLKQALGVQNRLFEQTATIHYSIWIRRSAASKKFKNTQKNVAVQTTLNKFDFFWLTNKYTYEHMDQQTYRLANLSTNKHIELQTYQLANISTKKHIDLTNEHNFRTYRLTSTSTCEYIDLRKYRLKKIATSEHID